MIQKANEKIREAMTASGTGAQQLADSLGLPKQTLYNKLCRDTMSYKTVQTIADIMGYDIALVSRRDGSII